MTAEYRSQKPKVRRTARLDSRLRGNDVSCFVPFVSFVVGEAVTPTKTRSSRSLSVAHKSGRNSEHGMPNVQGESQEAQPKGNHRWTQEASAIAQTETNTDSR